MATLLLPNGTPLAVTGSWDATVRIWNLTTGQLVGDALTGHTREVTAVATLLLADGTPLVVTGSADNTVRVWNLATGQEAGEALPHLGSVSALSATCANGKLHIIIAGEGIAGASLETCRL